MMMTALHAAEENTKRKSVSIIAGYLIGLFAIFELERMINVPSLNVVYNWLTIIEYILVEYTIGTISFRENKWMGILAGGLVVLALASLIRGIDVLIDTKYFLDRGLFIYLLCPAVPLLIPQYGWKKFFRIFIGIWTGVYFVICTYGMALIPNGITVSDIAGDREIGFLTDRLTVFYFPTISSANLTLTLMLCLIGMQLYQKKIIKIFYVIQMIPMFFLLTLTNGRAGYVATAIGFGFALMCALYPIFQRKIQRKWLIALCCGAVTLITALIMVFAEYQVLHGYNSFVHNKNHSGLLISEAMAEENEKANEQPKAREAAERQIINNNTLTGRIPIWRAVFRTIENNPILLLTGTSAPKWRDYYDQYSDHPGAFFHVHNILLQILLETGIPGVILALWFLGFMIRRTLRLIQKTELPLWQRLLFLPAAAGMMIECVECQMWLRWRMQMQVIVMLFAGATLVLGAPEKSGRRTKSDINVTK